MEPTEKTLTEIGRLCGAWAFLEINTETTLWGILGIDEALGETLCWPLDMRQKWQKIIDQAPKKLDQKNVNELRVLNKLLVSATRDRNIIVHGLVHMAAAVPAKSAAPEKPPLQFPHAGLPAEFQVVRVPCWTIYKGADAGKNFPISTEAVEIVRKNIQLLGHRLSALNASVGFKQNSRLRNVVENSWPIPFK